MRVKRVNEAIMTTGIGFDNVMKVLKSGDLAEILNELINYNTITGVDCPYQITLDTAAAINRVIRGNSAVARPCESIDDQVIVEINKDKINLMTGQSVTSAKNIDADKLSQNTFIIEDEIRRLCRPLALGKEYV